MNHLHFTSIHSTQIYLKENIDQLLKADNHVLISCDEQTNGIGRSGNQWKFNPNGLAFSFSLPPHMNLTLTPIEMGLIIAKYFNKNFAVDIKLKWPNDLMNEEQHKIGGIIANFHSENQIIVGVGINIGPLHIAIEESRYQAGTLNIKKVNTNKDWCAEIYQFILDNRMQVDEVINQFKSTCLHYKKSVTIYDGEKSHIGIFEGINAQGAALLDNHGVIKEFISGSLSINH